MSAAGDGGTRASAPSGGRLFLPAARRSTPACPPCNAGPLDAFDAAFRTRSGQANLVSVGLQDSKQNLAAAVRKHAYTVPVAVDCSGTIANKDWGLQGIPTLVLLDAQGRFVGAYSGFPDSFSKGDLGRILDALVAGRPLPHVKGVTKEQL